MKKFSSEKRVRHLNQKPLERGPIVYWMSRDQRLNDNWALLFAQELALQQQAPLFVVFCLLPTFLEATERQYGFMLKGLAEVEQNLRRLNISFHLLTGKPEEQIIDFCQKWGVGVVVSDFSPLRINREWKKNLQRELPMAFYEVDTHNIIPCWEVSPKQEYAAYTIRPKIRRMLPDYLRDIPMLRKHPQSLENGGQKTDWHQAAASLKIDLTVKEVPHFIPGEKAAWEAMLFFVEHKLDRYDRERNNPTLDAQSNLSPYLHFGHLSAQRLALMVEETGGGAEGFLEELIVRRELSDNFCYYNEHYDTPHSFPNWAKESLRKHATDPREYLYEREEFENAKTHDPLWNAAQLEMVVRGKMHGYMRMYWAKKIFEWTSSPEEAQQIAIYLNDKYSLDGRDPNGYAGIAWSIGGVHDRAWKERPIFGKIRYMNYRGSQRKFKVDDYIKSNS